MELEKLFALLTQGGPVGMAAIAFYMWFLERQERRATSKQLLELAQASIASSAKTSNSLETFGKTLDRVVDRLDSTKGP